MVKTIDRQKLYTRRAIIIGGVKAIGFSALAARLYHLQFIKAQEYTTLSENNRIKLQLLAPPRGHILDREGEALAINEKNYQLFVDFSGIPRREMPALVQTIAAVVPLNERLTARALEVAQSNPFAPPQLLKEHLSWEEVSAIELRTLDLPGAMIDRGQVRYYPFAEHSAHLLGYVGAVSPEEMEDQPLLRLPEFKIGKSAIEKMLETRLRGSAGIKQVEVDVHGSIVRELSTRPSIPGENVRLTIDNRLQEFASMRLGEESGAIIVMDVGNGDILAMASMPGFDPNIFSQGIPTNYWKSLKDNVRDPLVNKAVQGQYPPGSTFKPLVGLAGLADKTIVPSTHVYCPGHFYLGDHRFNCWKEGGHGTVDMKRALAESCDTFFYTVAQRTGIEPITEMARKFGLGELHLPGFLSEKLGLVPDPKWKQKRHKQRWQTGDTINAGIGQGYVLTTPLQLAVMTARLASGMKVIPRLILPPEGEKPPVFESLEVDDAFLQLVHDGLVAVVNAPNGTAYGKRIIEPGMEMAGKTGTSQVRKILVRGQKQELLPWEHRHHALFTGYAPLNNPRFAVAVLVEHGGGGSAAAAPMAKDILLKAQQLLRDDG